MASTSHFVQKGNAVKLALKKGGFLSEEGSLNPTSVRGGFVLSRPRGVTARREVIAMPNPMLS
jgi:hypothetical protein